jgi:hypothetical protein
MTQGLGVSLQQLAQCVWWESTPSPGVESGSSVSISARASIKVIGYRQMRWFFATRRRSWLLLVLSVFLDVGLVLLLDSSANSTASLRKIGSCYGILL